MKILVTGSTGFIGKHLADILIEQGHEVTGISKHSVRNSPQDERYVHRHCNLADLKAVQILMDMVEPEAVFHLAANPNVRMDTAKPTQITLDNVLATHNLLASCKPETRFVYVSSAAVYGDRSIPFHEEYSEASPTSIYAWSKRSSEELVWLFDKQERVQGVVLRPTANVGPGATHGVVKDILEKLKSDSPDLKLFGESPGSCKPYTYVVDTAQAIATIGLHAHAIAETVNIGVGDAMTVLEVAQTLMDATGIYKPISWSGFTWVGDNPRVQICNAKAFTFGWMPKFPTSKQAVFYAGKAY